MKRSNPIARTSIAVVGTLVLAFSTGCDQQGGQLTQLTESFQKKIDEKDKQLTEARAAQQVAVAQKSEIEGKLTALQAELDKAHATPSTGGGGPAISMDKLAPQIAALLDPVIRKAVKDAVASLPAAPAPIASNPPVRETPPVRENPTLLTVPKNRPTAPPKDEIAETPPPRNRPPKDDGVSEVSPRNPKDNGGKGDPSRPPSGGNKIPIEFPPLK
jgi:hypothetical protein